MNSTAGVVSGTDRAVPPKSASAGRIPGQSGMWFFILGDLLIFGAYFIAYMIYREQNETLFLQGQQQLDQGLGITNTVALLTSSLFVALGTESVRAGKQQSAFRLMGVAFTFGLAFPLLKMFEWIPKLSAGLTPGDNLFFMFYYFMTGLHLCHVILGLIILVVVLRELRPASDPNIGLVETGAIYWHMVDLLWLVLLALLYLMR